MNTSSRSAIEFRTLADVLGVMDGVDLRHLPAFTTLIVRTMNSLYRVIVTEGPKVYVQGGPLFPDPTPVFLDGASIGDNSLKTGWIGVGLPMEIRAAERRIVTSRVLAISIEPAAGSASH